MIPGAHMPPAVPLQQGRRQSEYHYQYQPAQAHSPVPPNPYGYHPPPQYHGHPHTPHYPQPWYPPYQQQHPMPPRPYQPPQYSQHAPLVVSSHPHAQPVAPVTRQQTQPPIVGHPHMPHPPQAAPPTPPVMPQARKSPVIPTVPAQIASPSPAPSQSSNTAPASVQTPSSAAAPAPAPVNTDKTPAVAPAQPQTTPQMTQRMPSFTPPLPWLSRPDEPFPPPASRRRRKRKEPQMVAAPVELPTRAEAEPEDEIQEPITGPTQSQTSTMAAPSEMETPVTSRAPSESDSTHPTTPSSSQPAIILASRPAGASHTRTATRTAVPNITPALPNIPAHRKQSVASTKSATAPEAQAPTASAPSETGKGSEMVVADEGTPTTEPTPAVASPPPRPAPKSWADLVKSKTPSTLPSTSAPISSGAAINGSAAAKAGSLAEVLRLFSVDNYDKIAFLEPRGLVNTGNMCYMNSILQVLLFCVPFWTFLDQVGKRATLSLKNETPLLESMIMFMREFKIIDSAVSAEQLRMRLKDSELEQYGEPFAPEFVYEVIRRLPRFSSMRRGHQQDAEEFLGFLLEGLHDECVQTLKSLPLSSPPSTATAATSPTSPTNSTQENGWLEVGPRQKASITRSSGHVVTDSPITKIFGGNLRSELRVPGLKTSVTLEPYQPLQLDIGAQNVNNITDALKGLTRSETLQGDFNSPRGPGTHATKQVFIETLPPVLILHLKRFQYDNTGGTQKIWKKIGYPLELEIPKEVFPPNKRAQLALRPGGLPRYRLCAAVYHHGKNASGGHYTVDVRRQEGREWIRLDDTVIRRVRSEDVAEAGAEEDPRVLAKALEQHKRDHSTAKKNIYEGMLDEDEEGEQSSGEGWSHVNGSAGPSAPGSGNTAGQKKWASVVNGSTTPSTVGNKTPRGGDKGEKGSKVAYILFYQQVK